MNAQPSLFSNRLRKSSGSLSTVAIVVVILGAIAILGIGGLVVGVRAAAPVETIGKANLALADGTPIGTVVFLNEPKEEWTVVRVELNVKPGATNVRSFHGFHIHANDTVANGIDCQADPKAPSSTWFVSADGHWKRDPNDNHGDHSGDMPSLYLNRDGKARSEFTIDRFIPGEIFNRAVILHAGPDNFANIPLGVLPTQYTANSSDAITATRNTGNSGDRIACGTIDVTRN